jgi:chromosome segregation ATPase
MRGVWNPDTADFDAGKGAVLAEQLVEARRAAAESGEQLGTAQQALRASQARLKQLESAEEDAKKGEEERTRLAAELRGASQKLAAAVRGLDVAQREAREAEDLFAAAADERAAKVKELVQEIDHWHDAATLAQEMEREAREELEGARAMLEETHEEASQMARATSPPLPRSRMHVPRRRRQRSCARRSSAPTRLPRQCRGRTTR